MPTPDRPTPLKGIQLHMVKNEIRTKFIYLTIWSVREMGISANAETVLTYLLYLATENSKVSHPKYGSILFNSLSNKDTHHHAITSYSVILLQLCSSSSLKIRHIFPYVALSFHRHSLVKLGQTHVVNTLEDQATEAWSRFCSPLTNALVFPAPAVSVLVSVIKS